MDPESPLEDNEYIGSYILRARRKATSHYIDAVLIKTWDNGPN